MSAFQPAAGAAHHHVRPALLRRNDVITGHWGNGKRRRCGIYLKGLLRRGPEVSGTIDGHDGYRNFTISKLLEHLGRQRQLPVAVFIHGRQIIIAAGDGIDIQRPFAVAAPYRRGVIEHIQAANIDDDALRFTERTGFPGKQLGDFGVVIVQQIVAKRRIERRRRRRERHSDGFAGGARISGGVFGGDGEWVVTVRHAIQRISRNLHAPVTISICCGGVLLVVVINRDLRARLRSALYFNRQFAFDSVDQVIAGERFNRHWRRDGIYRGDNRITAGIARRVGDDNAYRQFALRQRAELLWRQSQAPVALAVNLHRVRDVVDNNDGALPVTGDAGRAADSLAALALGQYQHVVAKYRSDLRVGQEFCRDV
ncbi:hypothetical protein BN131_2716 [Cronobacter malonaticus 681]|nr:hypothetical protein BN131_2716 [Cronobacter malonaticus 681]